MIKMDFHKIFSLLRKKNQIHIYISFNMEPSFTIIITSICFSKFQEGFNFILFLKKWAKLEDKRLILEFNSFVERFFAISLEKILISNFLSKSKTSAVNLLRILKFNTKTDLSV